MYNIKQSLDHLVKISAEWQTLSRHYLQQCNSSNDELSLCLIYEFLCMCLTYFVVHSCTRN